MGAVFLSFFSFGLVDMFNPDGISMVMILLPMVKKRWHALLFTVSCYVAYVLCGVGIYFGVDAFLKDLYIGICADYPKQVAIGQFIVGGACLIGAITMTVYLIRSAVKHKELTMNDMFNIRSVSPMFIVLFAIGSTWSQLFTFVTLIAFIGVLVSHQVACLTAILWIIFFCMFSSLPPLGVYVLSSCINGEKFRKIMNVVSKVMTYVCFYSIPVLLIIGAWWGLGHGIGYFILL